MEHLGARVTLLVLDVWGKGIHDGVNHCGLVVVGRGIAAATAEEGDMAAAPVVAAVAAAAVTAAGVEALLRRAAQPAPALPPRYELEGDDEDEEWRIASGEDPPEV